MSEVQPEIVEDFYGVYLLYCINPKYKGRTYIGYTRDPNRRIMQHNRGTWAGGAHRTNNKGPWKMVMIVHGFPNNISALRFEWAWQNPTKTIRLQHLNLKKIPRKESEFKFKLRVLSEMLLVGPWCRLLLIVRWLETEYMEEFPAERKPPDHMTICQGPVKSRNLKSKPTSNIPSNEECLLCSNYITNGQAMTTCLNPSCELLAHITCLADLFLVPGEYVPIEGNCPFCRTKLKWGDLIRKMKGCSQADGEELSDEAAFAVLAPVVTLNDGNKMPVFALGTGRGTAKETESLEDVKQAVIWAIEAGYRHIDTASIYGDEEHVGQGIAEAIAKGLVTREEMFVTTKLWSNKHAKEQVVPALKESLKRLALDYVDLYLIHFPSAINSDGSPSNISYLETWKGMEEAKKLNLTKSIGISNFNAAQIYDFLDDENGIRPAVNEVEVNPTHAQEVLISHCLNLDIVVMGYSPFGYMVSRKSDKAPPPRFDDPLITALATKYKKTPAQIVLNWLYTRDVVPVAKSVNKKRIAENIDIFDFTLNEEEVNAIAKFDQNLRVIDFKSWQDYPNYPFLD